MPYANISVTLTAAQFQAIKDAIAALSALLTFLINLTKPERRSLVKTGPGSVGYVQTALTYAKNHPEILPPSFSVPAFEQDVNLFTQLSELLALLKGVTDGVDDTTMAVGSEAKRATLQFYDLLKNAAKTNPGLQPLVDELARLFQRESQPTPPTPTPVP